MHEFELLEEYGNELREPYSKYIEDIWIKSKSWNRYFKNLLLLTNGYVKKNQKIERGDLNLAKKYRIDFLSREEEKGWI